MFTVNGELWTIYFVEPNDPVLLTDTGEYTIGVTDDRTKGIYISKYLDRDLLQKVIIHEITHAFMFSENIYMDLYSEELFCNIMAFYARRILNISCGLLHNILGEA